MLIGASLPAQGAEAPPNERSAREANESLRAQLVSEMESLREAQAKRPSTLREKKLGDLKLVIEVLDEDRRRMDESAAEGVKAAQFLKELVEAKLAGRAPSLTTRLHEQALELVAANRFDEAAAVYEEIVLTSPDDDEAYLILGHVRLMSGRYAAAEEAFRNAAHIDPSAVGEIVPFYENRVLADPNDAQAFSDLGYAWVIVGDAERAVRAFRDALTIDPANASARKGLRILTGQS
jgi:Flp pilus assembly protein TadD